jgi:acyl-CoA thioesterase FadM
MSVDKFSFIVSDQMLGLDGFMPITSILPILEARRRSYSLFGMYDNDGGRLKPHDREVRVTQNRKLARHEVCEVTTTSETGSSSIHIYHRIHVSGHLVVSVHVIHVMADADGRSIELNRLGLSFR